MGRSIGVRVMSHIGCVRLTGHTECVRVNGRHIHMPKGSTTGVSETGCVRTNELQLYVIQVV